jgi:molecular chaperone GrpE
MNDETRTDLNETETDLAAEGEVVEPEAASAAPAGDPRSAVERERDEYLEHYRRVAAEFDNYKKRMAREHEATVQRASARIVGALLPVLDDLERAVAAFEAHDKEHVEEGVRLVHRALRTLLEKEGLIEIDPLGEAFDPHLHEALLQQPSDAPPGSVVEVLQKGFQLHDRVIRPARVVVAVEGQAS